MNDIYIVALNAGTGYPQPVVYTGRDGQVAIEIEKAFKSAFLQGQLDSSVTGVLRSVKKA
jgi:hypothetical protein